MLSALGEGTLRLKRQRIKLEKSLPVPPQHSEASGPSGTANSGAQGIHLLGPDDVELLIEPYDDGFVWRIRNRRIGAIQKIRFEIRGVQSFDAEKAAFREATTTFRAYWLPIHNLSSGEQTKGIIFVALEGEGLRLGESGGMNLLPWPNGDQATARRWLLNARIVEPSKEWPIQLDLRWTAGTKAFELKQYADMTQAHMTPAPGSLKFSSGRKVEARPKRRDFLERLSPDDPNYEAAKRFYLEAWADSHGLVAEKLAGRASLSDILEGCVRTFEQAAELHVAFEGATPLPARCRELDRMARKSIHEFSDLLPSDAKRHGKANVTAAINEFSRRVNEIAARSKQRILKGALDREATLIKKAAPPRSELAAPLKPRATPDKKKSNRGKSRSGWLDGQCSEKHWSSDLDIANKGGPSYNTIRRYRSGQESTRDAYVRNLLAKAFGCKLSEVPK